MALKLGPRQGELRALRWSDLDLDSSSPSVSIERSVSTQHGVEWGPTKTGETRRVRLPISLAEALRRHHKAQLETRMMAGSRGWEDPRIVFPNARGALLRHQTMWRQLDRDRKKAGLTHFRFHDLRHTAATLMLAAGTPVNVVSHVLGLPDMQDVAAKAMDRYAL
jgi:integrase